TSLWHHGDREYVTHEVGPFEDGFVVTAWDRTDGPVCLHRHEGPPPATPADLDAILLACGVERPERRAVDEPWRIPCKNCRRLPIVSPLTGSLSCPECVHLARNWTEGLYRLLMGRRATDWRKA
ncbi:MAG TPA: hypothetical protein VM285_16455, partial [Polyangia bacterium]|nr:hypothetical protein [Polyangia bacterium]